MIIDKIIIPCISMEQNALITEWTIWKACGDRDARQQLKEKAVE
jgi:hypothetical protein